VTGSFQSREGPGIVVVACTTVLPPRIHLRGVEEPTRSGGAHELGGAPAEKLNGMIIIMPMA